MKNIKQSWKTTLLGVLFVSSGVIYTLGATYFQSEVDYRVMSILIASGIALIFSPDTFINKLNSFIGRKSKEI